MKQGFAQLVLIALTLIFITSGLAVFFIAKNKTPQTLAPSPITKTNVDVAIKDAETADWKTYSNQEANFTLKYPEVLKPQPYQAQEGDIVYGFSYFGEKEDDCKFIDVAMHDLDSEEKMKEWIGSHLTRSKTDIPDVQQSGYRIVYSDFGPPDPADILPIEYSPYSNSIDKNISGFWIESGPNGLTKHIFIKKEKSYAEFATGGCHLKDSYKNHPDVLEIIEHMIPTFRPINKLDGITWKTYTNEKYAYALQYPPDWQTSTTEEGKIVVLKNFSDPPSNTDNTSSSPNPNQAFVLISVFDQEYNGSSSLEEYLKSINVISNSVPEKITISGYPALTFNGDSHIFSNGKYVFKSHYSPFGSPHKATYQKIISTLKFTQ